MDTALSGGSAAAHLRYKAPDGRFIAQQELASMHLRDEGVGDSPQDEELQSVQDLASLSGFMQQLRAGFREGAIAQSECLSGVR